MLIDPSNHPRHSTMDKEGTLAQIEAYVFSMPTGFENSRTLDVPNGSMKTGGVKDQDGGDDPANRVDPHCTCHPLHFG